MPELPDIAVYIDALERYVGGRTLKRVRLASPFLLRSVDPPLSAVHGCKVQGFRRIGKRIVWELEQDLFMVVHLMIAGRLRWKKKGVKVPRKRGLAAFDFEHGSILFTEASSRKRASLYVVRGEEQLQAHDPGGVEVADIDVETFGDILRSRNHTLKRGLTDPRILSGIGNAYSDEILFRARMSLFKLTSTLTDEEVETLYTTILETLDEWTARLKEELGEGFPDKVTAFRPEMFVHGRYKEPCKVCGTPIQRVRYTSNEANYCPECQNEGRLFADRSLSRLLKKDWPKTYDQLESMIDELSSE